MILLAIPLIALAIMLIPASFIVPRIINELKRKIPNVTIIISHK